MSAEGVSFYRCTLCQTVISPWDIQRTHGCPKCGGTKMRASNLSLREKLVQVFKHPQVWRWSDDSYLR